MAHRKSHVLIAGLSLLFVGFGHAAAEPSTSALTSSTLGGAQATIVRFKLDARGKPAYLARFSDGPRNVARARGTAKARAERLGLGSHEATRHLLWSRPDPSWLTEIDGEVPQDLLWPVVGGHWGRGFGYTRTLRPELAHNGVDIGAKAGTVVRAAADGMVVYSDNGLKGYGNCVMILHANGWLTLYAHTMRTTVQPGWRVKRGERIGLVGQTGYAWGPHLHFELRDNGKLRNPKRYFKGYKSSEVNGLLVELESDGPLLSDAQAAAHAELDADDDEAELAAPSAKQEQPAKTEPALTQAPSFAKVEHFLREAPDEQEKALAAGRTFRNLLWPVKGGALQRAFAPKRPSTEIAAPLGSAVRAAADGIVVYSGDGVPGYGNVVVLLHGNGWVTVYAGNQDNAVQLGQRVLRGEWIAHVGAASGDEQARLRFEWLEGGARKDPRELLTGAP